MTSKKNRKGLKTGVLAMIFMIIISITTLFFILNLSLSTNVFDNTQENLFLVRFNGVPDPLWNSTWGGPDADIGQSLTIDGSGNLYMSGLTYNAVMSRNELFIAKYDPSGSENWSHTYGEAQDYGTQDIEWDGGDYIYLAATTNRDDSGYRDSFIGKYALNGTEIWTDTWGLGGNSEVGFGIATNGTTNAYITGGSYTVSDRYEMLLIQYNTTADYNTTGGSPVWSQTYHNDIGTYTDFGYDAIVSGDNIYVTGITHAGGVSGSYEALLLKYNSSGDLLWDKAWGGVGLEQAYGITMDESNSIYITGMTNSFGGGDYDAFVVKYNEAGDFVWNRIWGGSGYDVGEDICIDNSNTIFITGSTDRYSISNNDTFVLAYDTDGNLLGNVTWGGSGDEFGRGITFNDADRLYVTGDTSSYGVGQQDAFLISGLYVFPIPPPSVSAQARGRHILISWTSSIDGYIDHYRIYKSEIPITNISSLTPFAYVDGSVDSYFDKFLEPGTYYYVVTAVDQIGRESLASEAISATVPEDPPYTIIIIVMSIVVGSVAAAGGTTTFLYYRKRSAPKPQKKWQPKSKKAKEIPEDEQVLMKLRTENLVKELKMKFSNKMYTTYELNEEKLALQRLLRETELSEAEQKQLINELFSLPKEDRDAFLENMGLIINKPDLKNSLKKTLHEAETHEEQNDIQMALVKYNKVLTIAEELGDENIFQKVLQKIEQLEIKP